MCSGILLSIRSAEIKCNESLKTIPFQFSDEYIPTKYSKDHKEIEVRSRTCKVEILDTAGLAQYWGMRDNMIRQGEFNL